MNLVKDTDRTSGDRSADRYTGGDYLQKNPTWHTEDSPWKAGYIARMIERNGLAPRSVCEVGCGAGEILTQLATTLPDDVTLTGYEISPQAYEMCRRHESDRLRFIMGDVAVEDGPPYDLMLVIDVIEHVEDCFGFLRGVRPRATHHVFHIPLDISVQRVLLAKPIMGRRRSVGHIHYYTKETALATLEDTGYEVLDYFYTPGSLELPARSPLYALGRLPLRLAMRLHRDLAVRILGGHSLMVLARDRGAPDDG